jgi:PadR family transcriptional regulator, regulatory protein PadR
MAKIDDGRLELLQGTLDMLVLRTLQWGPQHGHGIGQAIRTQSDDLLKVETGSLYPALHRLVKRGWLKAEWGVSQANQRAKFYRLTAEGKKQLLREDGGRKEAAAARGVAVDAAGERHRPDHEARARHRKVIPHAPQRTRARRRDPRASRDQHPRTD